MSRFITRTIVGGLLFLLPLALILFLLGHLLVMLQPPAAKVAAYVGQAEMGPGWLTLLIVLLMLVVSFLFGLAASTVGGRMLTQRLEGLVLNQVPGYSIIKGAAADAAASMAAIDESERKKAVLVRDGDAWQIGFVTGRAGPGLHAVFLPDAPSPESGTLLLLSEDRFVDSGLSVSEALACLRRVGANMPPLAIGGCAGGDEPQGGRDGA